VDALGKTKRLQWDASGQLLAYTDCSGRTTRYEYNLLGHVARTINALGQTTQYQHDALGRLVGVTQADGSVHRYEYDAADNLVAYTDPLGAVTRYRYNGLDQPIERVDALGHSLQYHYDMVGRLVALQNENAAQYQFHYDLADNLIQEVGFDGRIQRYRYNAAGELTELHERSAHEALDTPYDPTPTAPLPKRTLFQRDVLGRLIAKAYAYEKSAYEGTTEGAVGGAVSSAASSEAPTTYTYDRLGRMQLAVNGDAQVSFAYDALSQLVEETQVHSADDSNHAATFTFKHQYDALGNRIQSDLPSGKTVQWLYYGSGHLHQLLVDGHVVSDMERDALHREISRSQGQLTSQYQFDPMGRLTAHRVSRNAAMQGLPGAASAQALYDKGRQSSPAGMAAGTAANALQATLARLPGGQQIQRQFQYDAAGNLSGVADSLRGTTRYKFGNSFARKENYAKGRSNQYLGKD
jgi:YD repeat-containing protein